jgi:hypothetical protein
MSVREFKACPKSLLPKTESKLRIVLDQQTTLLQEGITLYLIKVTLGPWKPGTFPSGICLSIRHWHITAGVTWHEIISFHMSHQETVWSWG